MLKKISAWYQTQPPLKKFGLVFLGNTLLWFFLSYIGDFLFPDISNTFKYRIFHAMWMGLWWTVFFNWKLVKQVFSKKQESSASTNNEPSAF